MNNKTTSNSLLYATIFLLSLTEFLQAGMTAFAAAPIMGELGIGPEEFSLVAAVYASIAIFAISMQRWFVERIGARRFLQISAAISVLGSLVCAASVDLQSFLAGRALMALGGGVFFTACRMIIHHTLAGPKRFVGIRCLASGLAIGIAAAPWLASISVAHETWVAIYGLLAALGVAVFVLAGVALPAAPIGPTHTRSQAGPYAQLLLIGSSFLLFYALQRSYYDFYGNALSIALIFFAAIAGLLAWLWHQHRSERPLLRVRQMLRPRYFVGLALFFFAYVMLGANNYVVPVMLQGTLGFAWETVGHVEALGFGLALVTWIVMSRLLPRFPEPRKFLVVGFASLALFGWLLTRIETGADVWLHVLPALAFNSIFLLTVLPVTAMQTFRDMERDEAVFSNAQQLKNMMAQAGTAFGITLATIGQQWRGATHSTVLVAEVNAFNPVYEATLQSLQQALAASLPPAEAAKVALARVAQLVAQQSSMLANIDHFRVVVVLGVLGVVVVVLQRVFR